MVVSLNVSLPSDEDHNAYTYSKTNQCEIFSVIYYPTNGPSISGSRISSYGTIFIYKVLCFTLKTTFQGRLPESLLTHVTLIKLLFNNEHRVSSLMLCVNTTENVMILHSNSLTQYKYVFAIGIFVGVFVLTTADVTNFQ